MRGHWIAWALAAGILLLPIRIAPASEKHLPQPDHVVVVILENHSFDQIMSSTHAPFIHKLARDGALFTNAYAVAHPSQPNYFALFSGSTHGVHDNGRHTFDTPTLASALAAAGKSFIGYAETGSPRRHNPWESFKSFFGYVDTRSPRKHNPWESFPTAAMTQRNLSAFPSDFARLPTVSFVIPDLDHDMHDGSVQDGDAWLELHLGAYSDWAKTHNSLLIVTFDEDDDHSGNHIVTIFYGAHVRPGSYTKRITHYSVLSTLLAMYDLPSLGETKTAPPIRTIWEE
jgi:phospholipase C